MRPIYRTDRSNCWIERVTVPKSATSLPGSTICLGSFVMVNGTHGVIIEGNIDPGSALSLDT